MSIVAGIDVGNSTTEIVLAGAGTAERWTPLAWDRAPTRGRKGSAGAWQHAARLLSRIERDSGLVADLVVITGQVPVETGVRLIPDPPIPTGQFQILSNRSATPGRPGFALAIPIDLGGPMPASATPIIAIARRGMGFRDILPILDAWAGAGLSIQGIATAGDEGVLLANRCAWDIPIIDEIDAAAALAADLVGIEVAAIGHVVSRLADPFRLATDFAISDRVIAGALADQNAGQRAILVARNATASPTHPVSSNDWIDLDGGRLRLPILDALAQIRDGRHRASAWSVEGSSAEVADLFGINLREAAFSVWARPNEVGLALAALSTNAPDSVDPIQLVGDLTARPVHLLGSESLAGQTGALSTPGSESGTTVIDLGGGTVDAMAGTIGAVSCAGGGELLTLAVATVLGIPHGAADWVKRGPSSLVANPHVLVGEDGQRDFLTSAAPADLVGALAVAGPAGLLPFHRRLSPSEWRVLRLRLKAEILGVNVVRALNGADPNELLLVGGPAGDEELLIALGAVLPHHLIGRGNVGVKLGHRWAVAYGLTLLADK